LQTATHFPDCDGSSCQCVVRREIKRYWLVIALAFFICGCEVAGGLVSGSLALLSDAAHVLIDILVMAVSLAVAYLVKRNNQLEIIIRGWGGRISGFLFIVLAGLIANEAVLRFWQSPVIAGWLMTSVAFLGMLGNFWQRTILRKAEEKHHDTHQAVSLHVYFDFLQSGIVVAGGLVILFTSWFWLDQVLSFLIAFIIGGCGVYFITKGFSNHHRPA